MIGTSGSSSFKQPAMALSPSATSREHARPRSSGSRYYYLSTAHDTAPYVDEATGEVRHGPVRAETALVVLAVTMEPNSSSVGRLSVVRDGEMRLTHSSADGSRITLQPGVLGEGAPTVFGLEARDNGSAALTSEGLYLCAEAGGRLTLSRQECSDWESFVLHPAADLPRVGDRLPLARRRVIVLRQAGFVANRMIQYMAARTFSKMAARCDIVGVDIPDWGFAIDDDTRGELFERIVDLVSWYDPFRPSLREVQRHFDSSDSVKVVLGNYLQRLEFLGDRREYNELFPLSDAGVAPPQDKDIVLHVRAGDILRGLAHYPLTPIAYYEDIVALSGLAPVFVGQLQDGEYVRALRSSFPNARYVETGSAKGDFNFMRMAKTIAISAGTFSWLAAWLSDARTIYLPMSGVLNPAHVREVDLLPVDDPRYRFFLFPLNYGLPETESLRHHERIRGLWKEVSPRQAAVLKDGGARLPYPRLAHHVDGLPLRSPSATDIVVDPLWYAHEYLDAAMEISEGWFEDPTHHYLEVGRLRGYRPTPG
jgi:hypothetical protein